MRHHLLRAVLWMVPLLAILAGCAGTPARPVRTVEQDPFGEKLTALINNVIATQVRTPKEMVPAAVMPGSLKSGKRFSRLEEVVMERLTFE
jgi:hypothetical protein